MAIRIKNYEELFEILQEHKPQRYAITHVYSKGLIGQITAENDGFEKTYYGKNGWCRIGDSKKPHTFRVRDITYFEFVTKSSIHFRFEWENRDE